eukprot:3178023-Alexandrium_andersonii.AAC.1
MPGRPCLGLRARAPTTAVPVELLSRALCHHGLARTCLPHSRDWEFKEGGIVARTLLGAGVLGWL